MHEILDACLHVVLSFPQENECVQGANRRKLDYDEFCEAKHVANGKCMSGKMRRDTQNRQRTERMTVREDKNR